MAKTISIIGAGGAMGRWFSDYFSKKGFQVTGFDNTNQPLITQASTTGTTGWVHNGEFINDELTTTPLTITGLLVDRVKLDTTSGNNDIIGVLSFH